MREGKRSLDTVSPVVGGVTMGGEALRTLVKIAAKDVVGVGAAQRLELATPSTDL